MASRYFASLVWVFPRKNQEGASLGFFAVSSAYRDDAVCQSPLANACCAKSDVACCPDTESVKRIEATVKNKFFIKSGFDGRNLRLVSGGGTKQAPSVTSS